MHLYLEETIPEEKYLKQFDRSIDLETIEFRLQAKTESLFVMNEESLETLASELQTG